MPAEHRQGVRHCATSKLPEAVSSGTGRMAAAVALAAAALIAAAHPVQAAPDRERHRIRLAQVEVRLTLPVTIAVDTASRGMLSASIGPGEPPRHSYLRIRGLPVAISLSEGHAIAPGVWAVPLHALAGLHLNVPAGVSGNSELIVSLVSEDGELLAESKTMLVVRAPAPQTKAPVEPPSGQAVPAPRPDRGRQGLAVVLTPQDRERAERLVARGQRDLEDGNVALARQFFLRAAEAGLARGALLLAGTYDPRELARLRVQGVQPNIAEARKWYERAQELGASEAAERLAGLPGS